MTPRPVQSRNGVGRGIGPDAGQAVPGSEAPSRPPNRGASPDGRLHCRLLCVGKRMRPRRQATGARLSSLTARRVPDVRSRVVCLFPVSWLVPPRGASGHMGGAGVPPWGAVGSSIGSSVGPLSARDKSKLVSLIWLLARRHDDEKIPNLSAGASPSTWPRTGRGSASSPRKSGRTRSWGTRRAPSRSGAESLDQRNTLNVVVKDRAGCVRLVQDYRFTIKTG